MFRQQLSSWSVAIDIDFHPNWKYLLTPLAHPRTPLLGCLVMLMVLVEIPRSKLLGSDPPESIRMALAKWLNEPFRPILGPLHPTAEQEVKEKKLREAKWDGRDPGRLKLIYRATTHGQVSLPLPVGRAISPAGYLTNAL